MSKRRVFVFYVDPKSLQILLAREPALYGGILVEDFTGVEGSGGFRCGHLS